MKYKSLLALHCTHDPITSLKPAIAMAKSMRAHLDVLVLNLAPPIPTMAFTQNPEFDWSGNFQDILGDTSQRVKEVTAWIKDKEVESTVTPSCQPLGLIDDDVAAPALYADLVLYHRCDESLVSGIMAKALEGVIFDAGKPALILTQRPDNAADEFKNISIAWDPVPGAMKSIVASLPMLKRAINVEVVIVAKQENADLLTIEAKPILTWLKRHDIDAQLKIIPKEKKSVSATLLHHINTTACDLVVMGAYGHAKLSERLFGGVSHTILDRSEKSLFMAH